MIRSVSVGKVSTKQRTGTGVETGMSWITREERRSSWSCRPALSFSSSSSHHHDLLNMILSVLDIDLFDKQVFDEDKGSVALNGWCLLVCLWSVAWLWGYEDTAQHEWMTVALLWLTRQTNFRVRQSTGWHHTVHSRCVGTQLIISADDEKLQEAWDLCSFIELYCRRCHLDACFLSHSQPNSSSRSR